LIRGFGLVLWLVLVLGRVVGHTLLVAFVSGLGLLVDFRLSMLRYPLAFGDLWFVWLISWVGLLDHV
jgi:hypothetical protein